VTTIRASAGELLEAVAPFDVYEGPGLEEGERSVAFGLRFRAADRTLTMEEVDARMARILERLESEHDVEQRA
jgi:phenylalanyl-tRNA synthetase beta chain